MTRKTDVFISFAKILCGILLVGSVLCGWGFSQTITVTPKSAPPTAHITVGGSGFPANSALDVYFDLTDLALAVTDSTGAFSKVSIQVPKSALPATHYVTAIARSNQTAAQTSFTVRTDWAQFGFNPGNARQNPYENVLDANSVTGLDLSWTFPTYITVYSTPAVSGGNVYFGAYDGNLYAVNATTGKKLWTFTSGSVISSSPAVSQGNVYFGSYDGNVYAVNAKTGAFVWSYALGGGVPASPTVTNGTVYIATSSNTLLGLNATTGALLWSYGIYNIPQVAPAVANGVVYETGDGLYAINATNGALIWYDDLPLMSGPTAVAQGIVYANWPDELATEAVNTVTGNKRWECNCTTNSFALGAGTLYGGFSSGVYGTSASTGQGGWTFFTPNFDTVNSSPAVANGVVYFGAYDGVIYALNATYGYELWSFQTTYPIYTSPVVANGMLYFTSVDGILYAFGLPSGPAKIARPNAAELTPDMSLKP